MTLRHVLVEGPDDVAALCELSTRLLGCAGSPRAQGVPRPERSAVRLTSNGAEVQIRAATAAKDSIPRALVFGSLPPQLVDDEAQVDRVAFFFDPDADAPNAFVDRVDRELRKNLQRWIATREAPDRWTLARPNEAAVSLRAVAWGADGPPIGGLDDFQNLERLLCRVMGTAYPDLETCVAAWLAQITAKRRDLSLRAPKWKTAVLLWAALVDEAATSDAGIPSRFLGQHKHALGGDFFADHVAPRVQAAGLDEPLAWTFG